MEFKVQGKPVAVTSNDEQREIQHGWIADDPMRPGQLLLCATNSYSFVRIPIGAPPEGDEHAKGMVPREALNFQADHPDYPIKVAERHVTVGSDVSFRRTPGMSFPDLARMLPGEPEQPMRFAIDTVLLAQLAEAMGSERVELVFDLAKVTEAEGAALYNQAVLVRRVSSDGKGQEVVPDGIIMPVRVEAGAVPPTTPPEEAAPPAEPVPPPEASPPEPPPAEQPPPPAEPAAEAPPEHPPPPTA